jgi:hypothetical protein
LRKTIAVGNSVLYRRSDFGESYFTVGNYYAWNGKSDSPPSLYNLKVNTVGLPRGSIVIDSSIGVKSITQFNKSIISNLMDGNFFGLFISSQKANNIIVYAPFPSINPPVITYRPRYMGVY